MFFSFPLHLPRIKRRYSSHGRHTGPIIKPFPSQPGPHRAAQEGAFPPFRAEAVPAARQ
jgi:hypothetical protein